MSRDLVGVGSICIFFFKQKTAYEMRISDWSSDVCSSDLAGFEQVAWGVPVAGQDGDGEGHRCRQVGVSGAGAHALHSRREHGRTSGGVEVQEIGRASCRERVCQYVSISVVAGSLKKKYTT